MMKNKNSNNLMESPKLKKKKAEAFFGVWTEKLQNEKKMGKERKKEGKKERRKRGRKLPYGNFSWK
jgi:hypothetical protein